MSDDEYDDDEFEDYDDKEFEDDSDVASDEGSTESQELPATAEQMLLPSPSLPQPKQRMSLDGIHASAQPSSNDHQPELTMVQTTPTLTQNLALGFELAQQPDDQLHTEQVPEVDAAMIDELECSVCYTPTSSRTPCGHLLCKVCLHLLPRKVCPLCRKSLPNRTRQNAVGFQRGITRGLRLRLPARQQDSAPTAPATARVAPVRRALPASNVRRGRGRPSPIRSPFEAWLRQREEQPETARQANDSSPRSFNAPDVDSSPQAASTSTVEGGAVDLNTGEATRMIRVADLISRIGRMAFQEVARFVHHVAWLHDFSLVDATNVALLQQAMKRRMAELFSNASLQSIGAAGDMLGQLEQKLGMPCEPLRRSLEARLSYLLYNPHGDRNLQAPAQKSFPSLEHLMLHYACATDLSTRRLVSAEAQLAPVSQLRQWLERASLTQLGKHVNMVGQLADSEPVILLPVLIQRVSLLLKNILASEHFGRCLHFVLDLQESMHGQLLTGKLEEILLQRLRFGLGCDDSRWPPGGIQLLLDECCGHAGRGALMRFCRRSTRAQHEIQSLLLLRLVHEVNQISGSIKKASDLSGAEENIAAWSRIALRAKAEGLLSLDAAAQAAMVDSIAKCTARCMNSKELAGSFKQIQNIEWSMLMIVGNNAQPNAEQQ
eukprot:TRINITY_DN14328_c0_g3_i1.p1 TRINITY_DN14328_c0_g3~~TRINITY_DN14328_c0_g3_i1.p1  ORF type:complete len:662 (+),score=106.03 TRINITY_DN14328_c0_g3_i1:147-2132(+)